MKLKANKNYIIIILFSFFLYSNSILNEYNIDDQLVTKNNELIKEGVSGIPEIFTTNYINRDWLKLGYRPLSKATFAVEYELFGMNPHVSHLINLCIYAFTGILLFVMLALLMANNKNSLALIITLLFVAHPIHTEVVDSLKNREELLSFMFGILTTIFMIKYIRSGVSRYMIFALAFFFLGVLSKLTIVVFIGIIPVLLYYFNVGPFKKILLSTSLVLLVLITVVSGILILLPDFSRTFLYVETPIAYSNDIGIKSASVFYALGYCLQLLFYPHPLGFYYGFNQIPLVDWTNLRAFVSLLIYCIMGCSVLLTIKKRTLMPLGILLYLIAIFPFSNIPFGWAGIVTERSLYPASLGFCIFIGAGLYNLSETKISKIFPLRNRNLMWILLIIILTFYSFKTITRNFDWKNSATLFAADIPHLKNSAKANEMYANYLYTLVQGNNSNNNKYLYKAKGYYEKALAIYEPWPFVHRKLGLIYAKDLKQPETAIPHFKRAIELKADYFKATFNLAKCYQLLNKPDSALKYYQLTLDIYPEHYLTLNNLAIYYKLNGNVLKAAEYDQKLQEVLQNQ